MKMNPKETIAFPVRLVSSRLSDEQVGTLLERGFTSFENVAYETEIAELRAVVETLHGCSATFREAVEASGSFQGQGAWGREVAVFRLTGHAQAKTAYAWSEPPIPGSRKARTFAVLGLSPVQSAREAVLASIAKDARWPSNATEGDRIALEVGAMRGRGEYAGAVALAEAYDLSAVEPETRVSVLLQAFYAAHEGGLEDRARSLARAIAKDEPALPSIQDYLRGR